MKSSPSFQRLRDVHRRQLEAGESVLQSLLAVNRQNALKKTET